MQRQHQLAVAEQGLDAADMDFGLVRQAAAGHAAQLQFLVAIHHQHRHRAVAAHLEADAAGAS
jgi:hypothetical protein